jgi:hypothetical protein
MDDRPDNPLPRRLMGFAIGLALALAAITYRELTRTSPEE